MGGFFNSCCSNASGSLDKRPYRPTQTKSVGGGDDKEEAISLYLELICHEDAPPYI